jgi:lysophospholipase L1-like esterase
MADLCWCYGASLTHGYTIVDDTFQYTPYAAELKSLSHGEVEGIASGYDGYTSEDLLEMIEMGPEMVLPQEVQANVNRLRYIAVLAGTNDLGHMSMPSGTSTSLGKAEVAEALVRPVVERVMRIIDCLLTGSALLRNAHSRRPIEFLVLAIPPLGAQFIGDPIFEWAECLRAAVNPALRRAGEKYTRARVHFVDAASVVTTPGGRGIGPGLDCGDGLHLSPAGYRRVAEAVWALLAASRQGTLLAPSAQPEVGRLNRAASPPDPVPVCYCYGDSLTNGYTYDEDSTLVFAPYWKMLAEISNGRLVGSGKGYDGFRTSRLRDQLECLVDSGRALIEPDAKGRVRFVALLGGTNDLADVPDGDSASDEAAVSGIVSRVTEIARLLRGIPDFSTNDRSPCVLILSVPPLGQRFAESPLLDKAKRLRLQLNSRLRELAETGLDNAAFVDAAAAVTDPATGLIAEDCDSGDGLHMSRLGYRSFAEAVWAVVSKHSQP